MALIRLWWFFICCNELCPRGCWWWEIMSRERGRAAQEQREGIFGGTAGCLGVLSPYSSCALGIAAVIKGISVSAQLRLGVCQSSQVCHRCARGSYPALRIWMERSSGEGWGCFRESHLLIRVAIYWGEGICAFLGACSENILIIWVKTPDFNVPARPSDAPKLLEAFLLTFCGGKKAEWIFYRMVRKGKFD